MGNKITTLPKFLKKNGFYEFEGYTVHPEQIEDLKNLTNRPYLNVMEIGFNAGHSAEIFLKNNDTLKLTSFDIGYHPYVYKAKEYIDLNYPNRHSLIIGDSTITIPKFISKNDIKFDVIFIDGGHDYEIVKEDLKNCFYLSHKDTIIILDDITITKGCEHSYTIGPTKSWSENLEQNKIHEIKKREYQINRGMSWGKYIF